MEKQYKYDAFISYRHLAHDKAIAGKLQKMLETYKPPKSVNKDFNQWRIFRDETELPTSSNLSHDIRDALDNSRFLIVVCSKLTKESRWCMEEITYFKEIHKGNNSNIITLIVDGEPSEVFPEELCNEMIEVTDDEGNVSYQNRIIEPLAANVAADSTKQSLKKLNTEFLRIAAPLLGCGYDTLYNRNHKRHIRRIFTIAALISLFLFGFSVYSGAMVLKINAQKAALQVANDSLEAKTQALDKSNRDLKVTNTNLKKKTKEAQDNLKEANKQRTAAEKNLAEAEKQRKIAEKNLSEANKQKQLAQNNLAEANKQRKIAEDNAAEANRQRKKAEESAAEANIQRRIAEDNAAEANRQRLIAEKNAEEARQQRIIAENNAEEARQQRIIAENNAEEANRQRIIAENNAEEANRQRKIAENNLAEANRQRVIAEQNEERANEQTKLAQIENSENLASISQTLWNSGDGVGAIETILSALPKEGENRPVVPTAEKILANEIGAYSQNAFLPVKKLTHSSVVESAQYAGKGKTLITQDSNGVYFWDVDSGILKNQYKKSAFSDLDVFVEGDCVFDTSSIVNKAGGNFAFDDSNKVIYGYGKVTGKDENVGKGDVFILEKGFDAYISKVNGETGELIWKKTDLEVSGLVDTISYIDGKIAVGYLGGEPTDQIIDLYDGTTGEICASYIANNWLYNGTIDGNWIGFGKNKCYYYTGAYGKNEIVSFDIVGNELCNPQVIYSYGDAGSYSDSEIICNKIFGDTMVNMISHTKSILEKNATVYIYDFETGKLKWKYELGVANSSMGFVGKLNAKDTGSYCDMIVAAVANKMVILNATDGSLIFEHKIDGNVNNMYYSQDGIVYVITQNGGEFAIPLRGLDEEIFKNQYYIGVYGIHEFVNKPHRVSYSNDMYAFINENSNDAHIYTDVKNKDFKEIYRNDPDKSNTDVIINDSGTYAVVGCHDYLVTYDINNDTSTKIEHGQSISGYAFMDDNHLAVDVKDHLYIYDLTNNKCVYDVTGIGQIEVKDENIINNKLIVKKDKSMEFIGADGNVERWTPVLPDKVNPGVFNDVSLYSYALSGTSKIAVETICKGYGNNVEVYDVITKNTVRLEAKEEAPFDITDAKDMVWITDSTLVFCKDNVLIKYDAVTGKYSGTIKLNLPDVEKIIPLGSDDEVAVICGDCNLYRIDFATGLSTANLSLKNVLITGAKGMYFNSEFVSEKNMLIINETRFMLGYIIDLETFKLRFEIAYYCDYSRGINAIASNEYSVAGLYPLYTTNELIQKALMKQ